MHYVALLNKKGEKLRFFNPVDYLDSQSKVPSNITFVQKGHMEPSELLSLGLVHDGLAPLKIDALARDFPDYEHLTEETGANEIMACLLLATGFCQRCLKRRWQDDGRLGSVQERLDFLYTECRRHFTMLSVFRSLDKVREDPFEIPAELAAMLEEVEQSANRLRMVSKDLQSIMGETVDL